jgi:hypothetical protein
MSWNSQPPMQLEKIVMRNAKIFIFFVTLLAMFGCGSVTPDSNNDGGPLLGGKDPEGGSTGADRGGAGGMMITDTGGASGSTEIGTGGNGGASSSSDGGIDTITAITGLTGTYYAGPRQAAYMTRIDATVNFDPAPVNLDPEEVSWTGEIQTDNTLAVEIQGNDDDQVSLTINGMTTPVGELGLTGIGSNTFTFGGWQKITIDIVHTNTSEPFEAILMWQVSAGSVYPVPTQALRPE